MAVELSTAGITMEYVAASTTGDGAISSASTASELAELFTTSDTKKISGITAIPEINAAPSTLEVTDLSDKGFKRYIPGLKDVGSAMALTMNYNKSNCADWNEMASACTAADKIGCYRYKVPEMGEFYYLGVPEECSFPAADVDAVFQGSVYITPNAIMGWVYAT